MKSIIAALVVMVATTAAAQIVPPEPTTDPNVDYILPRGVGVIQVLHETHRTEAPVGQFTTFDFLEQMREHDIRIAEVWIAGDPFDGAGVWKWKTPWGITMCCMGTTGRRPLYEDMDHVWRHPDIDVIVVRFTSIAWTCGLTSDSAINNPFWVQEPTLRIARKLFRRYGKQNKTIIFTSWESDNQWWMEENRTPTRDHAQTMDYVRRQTERRQRAIERARSKFPNANLKIYHALTIDDLSEDAAHWGMNLIKDVVPYLERSPDFIGVSYWPKHKRSITEVLHYIQEHTGYPAHRLFVAEVGASERRPKGTRQYDRITSVVDEAFDAGYSFAIVWMWRQTWHAWTETGKPKNFGMWEWSNEDGEVEYSGNPNSGLQAIEELNATWR